MHPNVARQALLVGVARADEHRPGSRAAAGGGEVGQRGGDQEAERSRAHDGHHVTVGDGGGEHGVHGTGHRLDRHRVGIAQGFGHREELALVGDEPRARPTSAGIGAVARLQSRADVTERDAPAVADLTRRARGARRLDAPRRTPEDRLEDDPAPRLRASPRRRRPRPRRAGRRPRGRARRGRRRCPRSSASSARRAWPGRNRRFPTGAGRRGTSRPRGPRADRARVSRSGPTPAPRPDPNEDARRAAA